MLRQLVFTEVTVVRERRFLSKCCRSGHPGCATAWAEPVRAQAKSVEGFSLIDMATKWGYWTLAERIKGLTQEAEIKETVAAAVQGGGSIPPQFKGTMLGKRMEAELKRQQGIKQRLVKNLRLEQKAAAREKARTTYFARGEQAGAGGSSTCVVM